MVKTPEDVFEIIKKECAFDGVFTQDSKHSVIDPLEDCAELAGVEWTWDDGVTKLVLIFKQLNFVIKIPFTGEIYDDNNHYYNRCDNCEKGESACEYCPYYDDPYGENQDYDDDQYHEFYGADAEHRITLQRPWDYCEAEAWYFQRAQQNDLSYCFAETRLLGYVDGHPIYTQQKAVIFGNCSSSDRTKHTNKQIEDTKEACKRMDVWCFNVDWLTDFIITFGDDTFQKFMEFIKIYGVNDLHSGNIGYIDGVPVLVDYSGYDG